jgi:hypothetical protein
MLRGDGLPLDAYEYAMAEGLDYYNYNNYSRYINTALQSEGNNER